MFLIVMRYSDRKLLYISEYDSSRYCFGLYLLSGSCGVEWKYPSASWYSVWIVGEEENSISPG